MRQEEFPPCSSEYKLTPLQNVMSFLFIWCLQCLNSFTYNPFEYIFSSQYHIFHYNIYFWINYTHFLVTAYQEWDILLPTFVLAGFMQSAGWKNDGCMERIILFSIIIYLISFFPNFITPTTNINTKTQTATGRKGNSINAAVPDSTVKSCREQDTR